MLNHLKILWVMWIVLFPGLAQMRWNANVKSHGNHSLKVSDSYLWPTCLQQPNCHITLFTVHLYLLQYVCYHISTLPSWLTYTQHNSQNLKHIHKLGKKNFAQQITYLSNVRGCWNPPDCLVLSGTAQRVWESALKQRQQRAGRQCDSHFAAGCLAQRCWSWHYNIQHFIIHTYVCYDLWHDKICYIKFSSQDARWLRVPLEWTHCTEPCIWCARHHIAFDDIL
jgi:hypothetical protein